MAGDIWKLGVSSTPRAHFKLALLLWIIADILNGSLVEGYHDCREGWCNYNREYCCGENLCCDYLTGYWYIWMITGILVFSVILICCWSWSNGFHLVPQKTVDKRGYIPIVDIGPQPEEYHIHQQPPIRSPGYGVYVAKEYRGQIIPVASQYPRSESPQASAHYPPPYSSIERRASPSAPPVEDY